MLHGDEAIGEVTQLGFDDGMGVLMGPFVPTRTYGKVSDVFRMYADGHTGEYFAARDALPLVARVQPGGHLLPAHTIHISDYRRELEDGTAIEVEVYLSEVLPQKVRAVLGV